MGDPRRILGVSPDATPDEIRRAYRALARQHHPDATGRAESNQAFAKISQAYEQLLAASRDPKRAHRPRPPATPPADLDPDDPLPDAEETAEVYDAFFSGPNNRASGRRSRRIPFRRRAGTLDLELDMHVSAHEAARGVVLSVPTPNGTVRADVPPGSLPGQEIRLPGIGVRAASNKRGDLVIVLKVTPASGGDLGIDTA